MDELKDLLNKLGFIFQISSDDSWEKCEKSYNNNKYYIIFIGDKAINMGLKEIIIRKTNSINNQQENITYSIEETKEFILKDFIHVLRKEKIYNILNERTE